MKHQILSAMLGVFVLTAARAEDLSQWKHFRPIVLNTSISGADVSGDVKNFPVAVALTAKEFDFSQAKADGSDIRFSGQRNAAPLTHSVEHFDPATKTALLWVKVPLVRGNNPAQIIFMHWGNAGAAATADSKTVFDVNDGFVGVWHLSEDANSADDGYKDATANAADGTGVNLKPAPSADGRIGRGLFLNHADNQWVKIAGEKRKLFDLTNQMTFSIWVKARSFSNKGDEAKRILPGYETMFAKGDNSWRLQKFGIREWHKPPADLIEMCCEKSPKGDLCVVGKTDMGVDKWYQLVGVHDHPKVKLYVNGVLNAEDTFEMEWKSDDHPVGIGNQSQIPERGRSWDGVLDEARVLNVPKDDNWIKLDYESQKEDQKFLTLGAVQSR